MALHERLLQTTLLGRSDGSVVRRVAPHVSAPWGLMNEFVEATNFTRDGIEEQINLEEKSGAANVCQVREVRRMMRKYGLWRSK